MSEGLKAGGYPVLVIIRLQSVHFANILDVKSSKLMNMTTQNCFWQSAQSCGGLEENQQEYS